MTLNEEEIVETRLEIEKRVLEWFDSFTIFVHKLVADILAMYERGEISQHDAYDVLTYQLIETYNYHDDVINQQLELYLKQVYTLGLESIDSDTTINPEHLAVLFLLFKAAKHYIYKAENHFLTEAIQSISIGSKLFTAAQMKNRFDMVLISEGTRAMNAGIIVSTTGYGVLLKFHTLEDEKVCPECGALDGNTYYPIEAWHLLPVHPYCRCYLIQIDPMDTVEVIE